MNELLRKRIIIVASVAFVLFVLICVFIVASRAGKVAVEVSVIPDDAKITLDGKVVQSGTHYIRVGDHVFMAEKDGWTSDKQTLVINDDINQVALLPEPSSSAARNLLGNKDIVAKREALGAIRADSRGKTFRTKNEIVSHLPYSDIAGPFKIDYGYNSDNKEDGVYLVISHSTPTGRKKALAWMRSINEDPTNYTIVFSDYTSPLDGTVLPAYNYVPPSNYTPPEEENE